MARSRRKPVGNPSIPRLEWVAKTHAPWVWYYTTVGWMLAVGMDGDAEELANERMEMVRGGVEAGEAWMAMLMARVEEDIAEFGSENTEYDRYIPWLAQSVNRFGKQPIKKAKGLLRSRYDDLDDVMQVDPLAFYENQEVVHSLLAIKTGESDDVQEDLASALLRSNALAEGFGTIARWAEANGINLNDYEPGEALEIAKEWARTRPKDEDIVGGDVVHEFYDGWTFQELKTGAQLRCEGIYLDHCVKHYSPGKIGKKYRIFSLRDPEGQPVATMEWSVPDEYVYQFKTMSNGTPDRDAVEKAVEFRLKYIDERLVSADNKLEQISHQSEMFPMFAGEFKGEFKGAFMPPGKPELGFGTYEGGYREAAVSVWAINEFVNDAESFASAKYGAGDSESVDAYVLDLVRKTEPGNIPGSDLPENDFTTALMWGLWKKTGEILASSDELLEQIGYYDLEPPMDAATNPRKRKAKAAPRKASESKRILDRSLRLWDAYDDHQTKKNFMSFVAYVDGPMAASKSLKVKTARTKAKRAIGKEWKLKGWKAPAAKPKAKTRAKRRRNPIHHSPRHEMEIRVLDEAGWHVILEPSSIEGPDEGSINAVKLVDPDNEDYYALITRSARDPGQWQATRFDERGPVGHATRDTLIEAVNDTRKWFGLTVSEVVKKNPRKRGPAKKERKNPAKGVRELEGHIRVQIVATEPEVYEIDISGIDPKSGNEDWLGDAQIEFQPNCDAWSTFHTEAVKGWGPFLYDVIMEFCTSIGSSLVSDKFGGNVSLKARRVWERYQDREDVVPHPLPPGCKVSEYDYLNVRYTKEPVLLEQLEKSGQLVLG